MTPTSEDLAAATDKATTDALVEQFWDPDRKVYVLGPGIETTNREDVLAFVKMKVEEFNLRRPRD